MEQLHTFSQTVSLNDIPALRKQMEQAMLEQGGDPDAVADLILAVNEALVNSVRHGYQDQTGQVTMELWRAGRSLVVVQRDAARPFDPTTAPEPDTKLPLALRPFGGMGIHMMRNFTDEMRYERTKDGRNQLTLVKYNTFP